MSDYNPGEFLKLGLPDPPGAEKLAQWFSVLADPTRLRLFSMIATAGEACAACDLAEPLGVSQPTVSHHLKALRDAGLVASEKRGRWVYYQSVPERLEILSRTISATR